MEETTDKARKESLTGLSDDQDKVNPSEGRNLRNAIGPSKIFSEGIGDNNYLIK